MNLLLASIALAAPELGPAPTPDALDGVERCVAEAGPVRSDPLPEQLADDARIALVVGVPCHHAPSTPSLRFSSRDAERVGDALAARGYTVIRRSTLVERASLVELLEQLAEQWRSSGSKGSVVVYFSGHGVLREVDGRLQRFWVFSDTRLDAVERTGLSLDALETAVQQIPAARRVVVQDTCFAASAETGGKGLHAPEGIKALSLTGPELGPVDTRLYASRFYEVALEEPTIEGSVYTDSWLAALDDPAADLDADGCTGLLEAHVAAARATSARRDGYQNPQWAGVPEGGGATGTDSGRCGTPRRGVVVTAEGIRSVEPGVWGEGAARRTVRAGQWADLRTPVRSRPRVLVGVTTGGSLGEVRGPVDLGGEFAIRAERTGLFLGTRAAVRPRAVVDGRCIGARELVARVGGRVDAGAVGRSQTRVAIGGLAEIGGLSRGIAADCSVDGERLQQLGVTTGVRGRATLERGSAYGAFELGAAGVPLAGEGVRIEPGVAVFAGVRL